jgi:hypothetical protein
MKKSYSILSGALLLAALVAPVAQAASQREFQDLVQQMDQQASEKKILRVRMGSIGILPPRFWNPSGKI